MAKLKTLKGPRDTNPVHPICAKLSECLLGAIVGDLFGTAWCIELAQHALAWEQIAKAENKPDLFVQNKIREKIETDKGVTIR